MSDVPDGWRLWPDGQPYPDGVELDMYGQPYEAAGFYALRQALEAGGCADPNVDAWNGLAQLRGLGFDILWERRSEMQLAVDRLTAENEVLRRQVVELLPWATLEAHERARRGDAKAHELCDRMDAGEFDD